MTGIYTSDVALSTGTINNTSTDALTAGGNSASHLTISATTNTGGSRHNTLDLHQRAPTTKRSNTSVTITSTSSDAKRKERFRVPFAVIVTLEIFMCFICIAAVLMVLSYETSVSSNNQCLDQGENSIEFLTTRIQSGTMDLVSSAIDYIVAQPLVVMQETIRLHSQGILDLHDYDTLWKYLYYQQTMGFPTTFPYYADADYGGFVSVYPENGRPNLPLEVGIIDATATIGLPSFEYNPKERPWYKLGAAQTGMTPVWTPPYVFAHSNNDTMPAVGISAAMPVLNDTTQELIGVLGCDITFDMLTLRLEELKEKLSPNAFIFVINDYGVLFASSNQNESTAVFHVDPSTQKSSNDPKYIKDLQDPNLLFASQTINESCAGNLSNLPPTQLYQSNGLIFQHLYKRVGSNSTTAGSIGLIIVAGAPITDYTGDIETTRQDLRRKLSQSTTFMLVAAAGIAIGFAFFSIPMTCLLVGGPMNRLNKHMVEVAKFDFSSLKGEDRELRSWIREIYSIESSFWHMVKQFAGAISENKKLLNAGKAGGYSNTEIETALISIQFTNIEKPESVHLESPTSAPATAKVMDVSGCISVAAVLMALSYQTSTSSNNQSLDQGESSISALTHHIQATTMELVSSSIDLQDYDTVWKYQYYQQTMGFPTTIPYYADEDYGGFIGVYPQSGPNTPLEMAVIDATAFLGMPSRCPKSCARFNMTDPSRMYMYHIANNGHNNLSISVDIDFEFNPRQRPWYKLGASQASIIPVWTPPYVFSQSPSDRKSPVGITAVLPIRNYTTSDLVGVLGCDISFDMLRLKLEDMKASLSPNAFIFVINDHGVLLASSNHNESTSIYFTDPATKKPDRTLKTIYDLQDQSLILAAQVINSSCSGNLSTLQPTQVYQSSGLIFQHLYKRVGNSTAGSIGLIIIAGAPITDYTGDIEETRKHLRKELSQSTTSCFQLQRGLRLPLLFYVKQFAGAISENKKLLSAGKAGGYSNPDESIKRESMVNR
ncbi:hypothetical protein HDU76_002461 [Blyttiomyces sp. JEL0837]|nr:hypothetical protein HDU76_002461 [Blyttiomyces sp. JEL0837]